MPALSLLFPLSSFLALSRNSFLKKSFLLAFASSPALRPTTVAAMMMASSAPTGLSASNPVKTAISLLDSVYGPVCDDGFPAPMPPSEAGLCADGTQRRYLWTDAFGVLAYLSLADAFGEGGRTGGRGGGGGGKEDPDPRSARYRAAADRLIDVVHECLGKPRSGRPADAMVQFGAGSEQDATSFPAPPTGYIGLRIGKAETRKVTDYGMRYDGQYWHYVDKWLLALARAGRIREGISIAKSVFPYFFDAGPRGDGRNGGIRWKLSVDSTSPPELQRAYASDDALVALIVFSILENEPASTPSSSKSDEDTASGSIPSLAGEIQLLRNALESYKPRVTDDPLGWGLEAIYDQFLEGRPRQRALHSLHGSALHPSHLSLPFRMYGAMIGARVASSGGAMLAPSDDVDRLVEMSLEREAKAMASGREEHSSINRGKR